MVWVFEDLGCAEFAVDEGLGELFGGGVVCVVGVGFGSGFGSGVAVFAGHGVCPRGCFWLGWE